MAAKSQTINPFLSPGFDKVIICDFESDGEHDDPIVDNKGQLKGIVKKNVIENENCKMQRLIPGYYNNITAIRLNNLYSGKYLQRQK